jgi:hypothetical protein
MTVLLLFSTIKGYRLQKRFLTKIIASVLVAPLYSCAISTVNCILISIQCYLLRCRLNSTSAYHEASTKAKLKHKVSTNTQKKTEQTQQKQCGRKK